MNINYVCDHILSCEISNGVVLVSKISKYVLRSRLNVSKFEFPGHITMLEPWPWFDTQNNEVGFCSDTNIAWEVNSWPCN